MVDLSFVGVKLLLLLMIEVVEFFDNVVVGGVFITYGVIDCLGVM